MIIRFFATIRSLTKEKEIVWDQPAPTLGDLLRLLSDRYGPEFRRWVLEDESLGGSILVVVNGNDARHHGGLGTPLATTDVVSIFPIMAGGAQKRSQRSASALGGRTMEPRGSAVKRVVVAATRESLDRRRPNASPCGLGDRP